MSHKNASYLEFESLADEAWEDASATNDARTESMITGVHFICEFFIGKNLRKNLYARDLFLNTYGIYLVIEFANECICCDSKSKENGNHCQNAWLKIG